MRRPGEGFVWQDAGTRLKVTGIELFSAGEQQAGEQDDIYTSWDPIDRHYRRLLLRDGRLRGDAADGRLHRRRRAYRAHGKR